MTKLKKVFFFKFLFSKIKTKNVIIFESHPDFSGNSLEVFEKLIIEKVNETHKIYWIVKERQSASKLNIKNVEMLPLLPKGIIKRIQKKLVMMRAKLIVSENRVIQKENEKTVLLHLHHGTILKNVRGIFNLQQYDFILCPSVHLIPLYIDVFNVKQHQIIVSGYPRNDLLFQDNGALEKLGFANFSKMVLWMPTFRQHRDQQRVDSENILPYGIPIIYSKEDLLQLNQILRQHNILLVIKVHPAQDIRNLEDENLSHIRLLFNEDLTKHQVKLYEFIGCADSLITDYSSVYYDYLLLNKPIAITVDDVANYEIGFVYENVDDYLIGEKIADFSSLEKYLLNVKNETDYLATERMKLNSKMNSESYINYTTDLYENLIKRIIER